MQEAPCRAMTRGLLFYYSFYYFCRPNCAKIGETIPSEKRRKVIKVYRIVEKAELFQDIQDYAKATKSAAINRLITAEIKVQCIEALSRVLNCPTIEEMLTMNRFYLDNSEE